MQVVKDFEYHRILHSMIIHALLHLLNTVSMHPRRVPTEKRNAILLRYLKKKVNEKRFKKIKKDIKLMIGLAREKNSNLENKLYQLNDKANQQQIGEAEKLYSLLNHLADNAGFESSLLSENTSWQDDVIYMREEDILQDLYDDQKISISMFIRSKRMAELMNEVRSHGCFHLEYHISQGEDVEHILLKKIA